jgi:hypothetical protein
MKVKAIRFFDNPATSTRLHGAISQQVTANTLLFAGDCLTVSKTERSIYSSFLATDLALSILLSDEYSTS